ncbi:4-hydroxy-tetrahydrodipicolinate reductase [Acuticoccus kandeliae]|uniref:4-hydroxy-tetrahydrodipicolinate reductase n=1 Tax=Acuticoccus kandeliae TaxID=2073160 RepID=UPI000D3E55DC|nr:4-hydroxy-tetrahydrodipicolinate reductase [Acuticoccus kandeliae]
MTRIGLYGAAGHMGKAMTKAIVDSNDCTVTSGCDRLNSPDIGNDLGAVAGIAPIGVTLTSDAGVMCDNCDVVVDYSAASATIALLPIIIEKQKPLLICTTGFSEEQHAAIVAAGRSIPVMIGANMSVSVMAMYELVKSAARMLGEEFDIEIFDFHPWDKIDAPSGTALELAEYAAEGRGVVLSEVMVPARFGETPNPKRGRIGFSSGRGGEVNCENTVFFAGPGQRLEIISRVTDYKAFAGGTLMAATWIASQPPGFYVMNDMLA